MSEELWRPGQPVTPQPEAPLWVPGAAAEAPAAAAPATPATPEKPGWQRRFLATLRDRPNVRRACEAAGIHRSTAYRERERNPEFARGWEEALDDGCDLLEDTCWQRATDGWEEPVYQGGKLVGHINRFNPTLAIFLLKAHRPEKFRERVDMRHSGPNGGPIQVGPDLSRLSPQELATLESLLAKAESGSSPDTR